MNKQQKLDSAYLRNHITIERLKSEQIKKWSPFLKQIDSKIREKLSIAEVVTLKRRKLNAKIKEIDANLEQIFEEWRESFSADLDDIATVEANHTAAALEAVGFKKILPKVEALITAYATNPLVVHGIDGGSLLKDFTSSWTKTERKRIAQTIRRGYAEGKTNAQLLQIIRGTRKAKYKDGILAKTNRNINTVIRTSVAHVASSANTATEKKMGVKLQRWTSTLDGRTSPICRCLDGQVYAIDKPPFVPAHLNCRSRRTPYLKGLDWLDEGATRSSEHGQVDTKLDYYEWLKTQGSEYQDGVIGRGRGEIFRRDDMTAERFRKLQLNKHFEPVSLEELKKKLQPA